jgi:hypothetical protein
MMSYAFFAPSGGKKWGGEVELRGLGPGRHHVVDYVNRKDYGFVQVPIGKLAVEFENHLLREAAGT